MFGVVVWLCILLMPYVLSQSVQDTSMCDLVAATKPSTGDWDCTNGAPTTDVCTWSNVYCESSVIKSMSMYYYYGYSGSLPDSIGSLTGLTYFYVSYTNVGGQLPVTIGSLSNLKTFSAYSNSFSGSLPPSISSLANLQTLNLGYNKLNGPLPSSIGSLVRITTLQLSSNSLTGSLPDSICSLSNLVSLSIFSNSLSTTLPSSIGSMVALTSFSFYDSSWSSGNNYYGTIPTSIGSLTNVVSFYIYGACFTGSIPSEIGYMTKLTSMYVTFNALTGPIPSSIGSLVNLEILQIYGNNYYNAISMFTGTIPGSIGSLTKLTYLSMPRNSFTGSLPVEIGCMVNLIYLELQQNALSGSLPSTLGQLTNLRTVSLEFNSFGGSLPETLGEATQLTYLTLYGNVLTGSLPVTLGSLTNLANLDIKENQLTGLIPTALGCLASVTWLALNSNQFHGSFPTSLVTIPSLSFLDINQNKLTGSLPSEFGNFTTLTYFTFSFNSFSAEIPSTFGSLTRLSYVDFSQNDFTGTLPDSLGLMPSLSYLNINSFSLVGAIPETFCSQTPFSLQNVIMGPNIVCYPNCFSVGMGKPYLSYPSGGTARPSPCDSCPPGNSMNPSSVNPSSFVCNSCPVDTYQPNQANISECATCPVRTTTATMSGQATCRYFRLVSDLQTIYIVLISIGAMYILAFAAAGEKSLAVILNMFLPMLDHVTDTFYVINESFYTFEVFQAAAFFLIAPCIIFGYDLVEDGDYPEIYMPFRTLWLQSLDGKPACNGKLLMNGNSSFWLLWIVMQIATLPISFLWTLIFTPFMLTWFLVGSFLYNSRTLAVTRVRRLWFYVWRGFKHGADMNKDTKVDTTVLNKALFSGFVLESMPQLIIQIYNSVMIGWGLAGQLSIAASVLMTLAGVYKFVYWRWMRGIEWSDIPVAPMIPNVPFLKLVAADAASSSYDPTAAKKLVDEEQSSSSNSSCSVDADADAEQKRTSTASAATAVIVHYTYEPATTFWQTIFWLRSTGGVPTYRGMNIFPSFNQHESIPKFLFVANVWWSCIVLQFMTILFSPLWYPLMILGVDVTHMSTYNRRHKGYLKQCILNLCSLTILAAILVKTITLMYMPHYCFQNNAYDDYTREICQSDYPLLVFEKLVLVGLFMLWVAYRLIREHWTKRVFTVILAAVLLVGADLYYFTQVSTNYPGPLIAIFILSLIVLIMTVMDVMKSTLWLPSALGFPITKGEEAVGSTGLELQSVVAEDNTGGDDDSQVENVQLTDCEHGVKMDAQTLSVDGHAEIVEDEGNVTNVSVKASTPCTEEILKAKQASTDNPMLAENV